MEDVVACEAKYHFIMVEALLAYSALGVIPIVTVYGNGLTGLALAIGLVIAISSAFAFTLPSDLMPLHVGSLHVVDDRKILHEQVVGTSLA